MASDMQLYIDFDPYENGLLVGLACQKLSANEWLGICIFNDDAQQTLFRLVLDEQQEPDLFLATANSDPWAGWAYNFVNIQPDLQPVIPMDEATGKALEQLASAFVGEWFWLDTDPQSDALAAQYESLGFEVFHINVRPDRIADMTPMADDEAPDMIWLVFDTVKDTVIKDVLEEYVLSPMG